MLFDTHVTDQGEQSMIICFSNIWNLVLSQIESQLKDWTKPATVVLVTGLASDLTPSRSTCFWKMHSCANN